MHDAWWVGEKDVWGRLKSSYLIEISYSVVGRRHAHHILLHLT